MRGEGAIVNIFVSKHLSLQHPSYLARPAFVIFPPSAVCECQADPTNKYGNCVINQKNRVKHCRRIKMLRMKMGGEGIGLVRLDYLSFKASLNPRRLEFGKILQALFTPRCFFITKVLTNRNCWCFKAFPNRCLATV